MTQISPTMKLPEDREMVPRTLVVAMFTLMGVTLALTAFATLTDRTHVGVLAESPVVVETQLSLIGTREGNVAVLNANGIQIAHSAEDKQGFIGVIWRVMERRRLLAGNPGSVEPIRLVRRENGHIVLIDPVTDMTVPLIGYGPDNIAAFARLID